ncbi:MAG: hypothetical protein NZ480_02970, partial [Bdellovibrionaceae bacterium]|nr:hypothetical protein [Pseudobdellovibrionaceae bacterium]
QTNNKSSQNENTFLSYLRNENIPFTNFSSFSSVSNQGPNSMDLTSYCYEPLIHLAKPIRLPMKKVLSCGVHPLLQERRDTPQEQKHFFLLKNNQGQLLWVYFSPHDHCFYLEGFFE